MLPKVSFLKKGKINAAIFFVGKIKLSYLKYGDKGIRYFQLGTLYLYLKKRKQWPPKIFLSRNFTPKIKTRYFVFGKIKKPIQIEKLFETETVIQVDPLPYPPTDIISLPEGFRVLSADDEKKGWIEDE